MHTSWTLVHTNSLDHTALLTIVDAFYQGDITRTEAFSRLVDLIHDDNIEALIASIPEMWRDEFVEFLASYDQPDLELLNIFGGIRSWQWESDPARREEGRRADRLHREAERAHLRAVVLPAIHAWVIRCSVSRSSQSG